VASVVNKTSSSYGYTSCVSDSDAAHLTGRVPVWPMRGLYGPTLLTLLNLYGMAGPGRG